MTRPFHERWPDMRDNCDQALKLAGMLPSAVRTAQDDPEFIESVVTRLSDQLCCLDAHIGDERPETLHPETRQGATGGGRDGKGTRRKTEVADSAISVPSFVDDTAKKSGMHLYPGQVELITRLFHEATDAGCELLTVLADADQSRKALRSGTLESLAKRVVQAMWSIRWEMNIDAPGVDDESEAP